VTTIGVSSLITERLLAAQHGRVWAENCPDGGARFTMAIPVEVHELDAEACATSTAATSQAV
jgi:hypothetical protein